MFCVQSLVKNQVLTFFSVFISKLWRFLRIKIYKGFDCEIKVKTINFCPNFNFMVKAFYDLKFLYLHDFEMKTDMNVKIRIFSKLLHGDQDLSLKKAKSQTTKDFRSRILKR